MDIEFLLGGAVDMFYRYGFFSLSVRVVPRDDPGSWLVREPTADIFDRQSLVIAETAGSDTFAKQPFQVSFLNSLLARNDVQSSLSDSKLRRRKVPKNHH